MASQTLVSIEELTARLSHPDWLVLDCRFDLADPTAGLAAYKAGHVPGAYYADLDRDLARKPQDGEGRHPLPAPEAFRHRLAQWGLTPRTQVVVYDDSGGGFAARAWWMLRWVGHGNVALLDGGFGGWLTSGAPTDVAIPALLDQPEPPPTSTQDWVAGTEDVMAALGDGRIVLDARAAERFEGRVEPIDPVAGHIPGALNYPFTESLGPDGRFRSPAEIKQRLEAVLGTASGSRVIATCGSGVTACHLLLSMEIAGMTGGALYAGSWSEWVADSSRPVACGPAEPA